jgi:hypothetical protein
MKTEKEEQLKELQVIPGVGKSISEDLWNIGVKSLDDLKGKDPEKLYMDICKYQKANVDRCILYVFRLAVYFAENKKYNKEKLKWWNWKDQNLKSR